MTVERPDAIELSPSNYDAIRIEDDGTLVLVLTSEAAEYMRSKGFDLERSFNE